MIHTGKYSRMEVYLNTSGKLASQIKKEKGCTTLVNGVLFEGKQLLCLDQKVANNVLRDQAGDFRGIAWSVNKFPVATTLPGATTYENFISSCPADATNKRGRTALAFNTQAGTYSVLCVADGRYAMTWQEANDTISKYGDICIVLDGGGSSRCICPSGEVKTSTARDKQNQTYILIWEEEVNTMSDKFKVCIDPGHGQKELNCSPDKTYYEYQYTWKLSLALRELLINSGEFDVIITKDKMEDTPSLQTRASIANGKAADIFISEHTNAENTGVCSGSTAWIYALGGKRQDLANAILSEYKVNGFPLFGTELYAKKYTVLAETNMPAVLMETYFHTSAADLMHLKDEDDMKLVAYAQACGICKYFGLSTAYIQKPTTAQVTQPTANEPTKEELVKTIHELVDKLSQK